MDQRKGKNSAGIHLQELNFGIKGRKNIMEVSAVSSKLITLKSVLFALKTALFNM